jgi:hypothetical protein
MDTGPVKIAHDTPDAIMRLLDEGRVDEAKALLSALSAIPPRGGVHDYLIPGMVQAGAEPPTLHTNFAADVPTDTVQEPDATLVAEAVSDALLDYLGSTTRGSMQILAGSLTIPSWRGLDAVRAAGVEVGRRLALIPGHGALLVLDCSDNGRWHAYGQALTTDREYLSGPWRSITNAARNSCKVKVVTGSRDFWDRNDNRLLDENLRRTVGYAFKALPPDVEQFSLADRVLCASGPFANIWATVTTCYPALLQPRRISTSSAEMCPHCGGPMPWRAPAPTPKWT